MPYPSVDLVLLHFALWLDHEKRVIEQEYHEIAAVTLCVSTLPERTLVDELAAFLLEPEVLQRHVNDVPGPLEKRSVTHHLLARAENALLVKLQQVEPVLCLARLRVDSLQKLANNLDDLR